MFSNGVIKDIMLKHPEMFGDDIGFDDVQRIYQHENFSDDEKNNNAETDDDDDDDDDDNDKDTDTDDNDNDEDTDDNDEDDTDAETNNEDTDDNADTEDTDDADVYEYEDTHVDSVLNPSAKSNKGPASPDPSAKKSRSNSMIIKSSSSSISAAADTIISKALASAEVGAGPAVERRQTLRESWTRSKSSSSSSISAAADTIISKALASAEVEAAAAAEAGTAGAAAVAERRQERRRSSIASGDMLIKQAFAAAKASAASERRQMSLRESWTSSEDLIVPHGIFAVKAQIPTTISRRRMNKVEEELREEEELRTATLQLKGRTIQLKLRRVVRNDNVVVILNKQYLNHDMELSSTSKNTNDDNDDDDDDSDNNNSFELYDEDNDKVDGAILSGITKGTSIQYKGQLYKVMDRTPFEASLLEEEESEEIS
jgi:energy-converting hydrogenase Eha subunit A